MKSITTCPSCQTQFLVTDEQLSQYNGKVRCGHCLNVFNAVDYISVPVENTSANETTVAGTAAESVSPEVSDAPEIITETQSIIPSSEDAIEFIKNEASEELLSSPDITETTQSVDIENAMLIKTSDDVSAGLAEPALTENDTFEHQPVEPITIEPQAVEPQPSVEKENPSDLINALLKQVELPLEEARDVSNFNEIVIEDVSIPAHADELATAQHVEDSINNINEFDYKPEFQYYLEQKKSTSPALFILTGLLIFAILLQCLFFYRHSIARDFPEAKPYLISVCKVLGCEIHLPKEIHLFSIDDSTIEEDTNYQGVIRLSSTITNRANFIQAYPNLEVTLTDTQDKPKLRRIFKPNEYLSKENHIENGIAAGDSISISMPLMADDLKPAGFRLLVTY